MTQNILETLSIPLTCKIGRKLFKKQFIENFSLGVNEKKILTSDIESITLEYLLNKDKINIAPFTDSDNDYSEIAFIRVELLESKRVKQLSNIIQYIPYPLIVVFEFQNSVCMNISPKRINKNDSSKLVVEESFFTDWIDMSNPSKLELDFIASLKVQNHPFTNFFAFYKSYLDKLIAFNSSKYSGNLASSENAREVLREIQEVEANISEIVSKIKKETNLKDKVKMNIELKNLSDELEKLRGSLR